jgi:hypothetical protein
MDWTILVVIVAVSLSAYGEVVLGHRSAARQAEKAAPAVVSRRAPR